MNDGETLKHIRPTRRTQPRGSLSASANNQDVVAKAEPPTMVSSKVKDLNLQPNEDTVVIQSCSSSSCTPPPQVRSSDASQSTIMNHPLQGNEVTLAPNNEQRSNEEEKPSLIKTDNSSTITAAAREKSRAGILRKPKYLAEKGAKELKEDKKEEGATLPVVVQNVVVERQKRSRKKGTQANINHLEIRAPPTGSAGDVEGYTPATSFTPKGKVAQILESDRESRIGAMMRVSMATTTEAPTCLETQAAKKASIDKVSGDDNEEPLIFNSLADVMAMAGTLPDQNDSSPTMVEAELNFSFMDPATFKEEQQEIFLGQQSIFDEDEDDDHENREPHSDDEEDDGLFDVLGLSGGLDEDDVEPTPPPRAFLLLWTAMAQWITPQAVAFVRKLQSGLPSPLLAHPSFDRSDVGASRCGGLMATLHLHTARCWDYLGQSAEKLRAVESQLADLVRCFDYSRPSPKFDIALTRALTCVLLDTVAQKQNDECVVPGPCQAVGMTLEEYRYLAGSAIRNFGETTTTIKSSTDQ